MALYKSVYYYYQASGDGVWGWQWHQQDHMQTISTSLQTDNHTTNSVKALKAFTIDLLVC